MIVEKLVTKEEELEIVGATLLSIEEAESLPERLRIYENYWWLRSPGYRRDSASIVYRTGSVCILGNYVGGVGGFVRPALIINLEPSNLTIGDCFIFGGKEFEIISDNLAFCKYDIGKNRFDARSKNYETSEIITFLSDWFRNNKEQECLTTIRSKYND